MQIRFIYHASSLQLQIILKRDTKTYTSGKGQLKKNKAQGSPIAKNENDSINIISFDDLTQYWHNIAATVRLKKLNPVLHLSNPKKNFTVYEYLLK